MVLDKRQTKDKDNERSEEKKINSKNEDPCDDATHWLGLI